MQPIRGDSAALRLYKVLSRLQSLRSDEPAGAVLKRATGCDTAAGAFALIYGLLEDIKVGIRAADPTAIGNAHIALVEPIEEWLSTVDLQPPWPHSKSRFPSKSVDAVLICHGPLMSAQPLQGIDDEELLRLSGTVNELLDDVLTAAIDDGLRRFILRHLQDVASALKQYRSSGSGPLVEVLDSMLGDFASTRPVPVSEADRSIWQRVVQLSKDVQDVVKGVVFVGGLAFGAANPVAAGDFVLDAYRRLEEGVSSVDCFQDQRELSPASTPELGPGEPASEGTAETG